MCLVKASSNHATSETAPDNDIIEVIPGGCHANCASGTERKVQNILRESVEINRLVTSSFVGCFHLVSKYKFPPGTDRYEDLNKPSRSGSNAHSRKRQSSFLMS